MGRRPGAAGRPPQHTGFHQSVTRTYGVHQLVVICARASGSAPTRSEQVMGGRSRARLTGCDASSRSWSPCPASSPPPARRPRRPRRGPRPRRSSSNQPTGPRRTRARGLHALVDLPPHAAVPVGRRHPPAPPAAGAGPSELGGAVYGEPLVVGSTLIAATEGNRVYRAERAQRECPVADGSGTAAAERAALRQHRPARHHRHAGVRRGDRLGVRGRRDRGRPPHAVGAQRRERPQALAPVARRTPPAATGRPSRSGRPSWSRTVG